MATVAAEGLLRLLLLLFVAAALCCASSESLLLLVGETVDDASCVLSFDGRERFVPCGDSAVCVIAAEGEMMCESVSTEVASDDSISTIEFVAASNSNFDCLTAEDDDELRRRCNLSFIWRCGLTRKRC